MWSLKIFFGIKCVVNKYLFESGNFFSKPSSSNIYNNLAKMLHSFVKITSEIFLFKKRFVIWFAISNWGLKNCLIKFASHLGKHGRFPDSLACKFKWFQTQPITNGRGTTSMAGSRSSELDPDRPSSRASTHNVEIVITGRARSRTDLCPDVPRSKFEHCV